MDRKSSLSPTKRAKIPTLRDEGYTERAKSARLKCSKNAVHNEIVKFKCDGIYTDRSAVEDRGKPHPEMTTLRWSCDHLLARKKFRTVLRSKGTDVSVSTVSRRLSKEFNLKSRKPSRKPRLTSAIKKKRPDFAKRHVSWTVPKWKNPMNQRYNSSSLARDTFGGQKESASTKNTPSRPWNTHRAKWFGAPRRAMGLPDFTFYLRISLWTGQDMLKCYRSWNCIWKSITVQFSCRMAHLATGPSWWVNFYVNNKSRSWIGPEIAPTSIRLRTCGIFEGQSRRQTADISKASSGGY